MSHPFAAAVLLGALALAPALARAQEGGPSIEQLMIQEAHTRAEHEALAKHFAAEASEARALAQRHRTMGQAYLTAKRGNKQGARMHCDRIAEQQEAIAKEYEALAKMHEQEAQAAE